MASVAPRERMEPRPIQIEPVPDPEPMPSDRRWIFQVEMSYQRWQWYHRGIVVVLWLHAIGLAFYALMTGNDLSHSVTEGILVAGPALGASLGGEAFRRLRSALAAVGLVTASGILVHLTGGLIESHFHFFVVVALVALYKDWIPLMVALVYVVGHHGLIGVFTPEEVYNNPDAWRNPWLWAMLHGVYVLAASGAQVASWQGEKS